MIGGREFTFRMLSILATVAVAAPAFGQVQRMTCPPSSAPLMPDLRGPLNEAEALVRARFPKNPSQTDSSAANSGVVASQLPAPCTPVAPTTQILLLGPKPRPSPIGVPLLHYFPPTIGAVVHPPIPTMDRAPLAAIDQSSAASDHDSAAASRDTTPAPDPATAPATIDAATGDAATLAHPTRLSVVYRREQVMKVGESNLYRVVIASRDLSAALARVGDASGTPIAEPAMIGGVARATLTGDSNRVEISDPKDQDQVVTRGRNVEWSWYVRPKVPGTLELTLTISNLVKTDVGVVPESSLDPLTDKITVQSTPGFWLPKLGAVWTALFGGGGIVVIIAGWFGWKRFSGGKDASPV